LRQIDFRAVGSLSSQIVVIAVCRAFPDIVINLLGTHSVLWLTSLMAFTSGLLGLFIVLLPIIVLIILLSIWPVFLMKLFK